MLNYGEEAIEWAQEYIEELNKKEKEAISINKGNIGDGIAKAQNYFKNWLSDSKYVYGGHQWLEEHLGFDDNANHIGRIDLYIPIAVNPAIMT